MDINNSIMDMHNSIMDIHNSIMDIHNSSIYGYPEFDLWISTIRFMTIHNSIYGYP